jgi:ATP-dependent Lhr-like helicase
VAPGTRLAGRQGLLEVLDQLSGLELPIGDWEAEVLPARLEAYDPAWLDELCLSGEVAWGRLSPKHVGATAIVPGRSTPSRSTPITFVLREDLGLWCDAVRLGEAPAAPAHGAAADVLEVLVDRGAIFRSDLGALTGRLPAEVDEGLFELLAQGLVTADGFHAVRALLSPARRLGRRRPMPPRSSRLARTRTAPGSGSGEGRWSLLDPGAAHADALDAVAREELAEAVAASLLRRWGIVVYELMARESIRVPWREITWAMRRLEAQGEALGGRFVAGLSGEQYALPAAVAMLHDAAASPTVPITLAATDPLNLSGILLPGPRVPAVRRRRIQLADGTIEEIGA